jgi:hypothetical protein
VVYQIEGEPGTVLMPGDVFYEPEGARIARFDAQEDGVTFLLADGVSPELAFPEAISPSAPAARSAAAAPP